MEDLIFIPETNLKIEYYFMIHIAKYLKIYPRYFSKHFYRSPQKANRNSIRYNSNSKSSSRRSLHNDALQQTSSRNKNTGKKSSQLLFSMTSSQPRQKKANKNVLAFRRSHGDVVSRRKVGYAASRWLRGGANFPCNYARLLFIIMYTNGALRDSANTPRHSNSKRISLIHRI